MSEDWNEGDALVEPWAGRRLGSYKIPPCSCKEEWEWEDEAWLEWVDKDEAVSETLVHEIGVGAVAMGALGILGQMWTLKTDNAIIWWHNLHRPRTFIKSPNRTPFPQTVRRFMIISSVSWEDGIGRSSIRVHTRSTGGGDERRSMSSKYPRVRSMSQPSKYYHGVHLKDTYSQGSHREHALMVGGSKPLGIQVRSLHCRSCSVKLWCEKHHNVPLPRKL